MRLSGLSKLIPDPDDVATPLRGINAYCEGEARGTAYRPIRLEPCALRRGPTMKAVRVIGRQILNMLRRIELGIEHIDGIVE
ncbi:MAG: hypothetical protein CBC23_008305 [Rhodospirillaceae bacterium TMED63]|nr:MAG: hypothetical protein CBC23_008305 [Rhodospirillaceae bacterium TMED63]